MIVSMETGANQWLRACILLVPVSTETCTLDCQKRSYCCPDKLTKWCSSGIASFLLLVLRWSVAENLAVAEQLMMVLSQVQCANPTTSQGDLLAAGWDYRTKDTTRYNLEYISSVIWLLINAGFCATRDCPIIAVWCHPW